MEGFLTKRGHIVKNWKQRWFVLQKQTLFYFKGKTDPSPIAGLSIAGATLRDLPDDGRPFCFELNAVRDKKVFRIAAGSEDELKRWKSALERNSSSQLTPELTGYFFFCCSYVVVVVVFPC